MKDSIFNLVPLREDELIPADALELIKAGGTGEVKICLEDSCSTNSGSCSINKCKGNENDCIKNTCKGNYIKPPTPVIPPIDTCNGLTK